MSAARPDQSVEPPMPGWPFDLRESERLARAALSAHGLGARTVERVPGGHNAVFAVRSAAGDRYALRLHVPGGRTPAEVGQEMAWLASLAAETGVGAPEPETNRDGRRLTMVSGPGGEAIVATVVSWVPGRPLAGSVTPESVEQVGKMLATLHRHAETWDRDGMVGSRLDRVWPFGAPAWLVDTALPGPLDDATRKTIALAAARVGDELTSLYDGPERPRVIHANAHTGNLKLDRGRVRPLDFDDCCRGFPIQDLAVTLSSLERHAAAAGRSVTGVGDRLRAGYCRVRPWPAEAEGMLAPFIAARMVAGFGYSLMHVTRPLAPEVRDRVWRDVAWLRRWLDGEVGDS